MEKTKKVVNLILSICFTAVNLLMISLLIWENSTDTFLYDISYIHKYRFIIIIVILSVLTILIWLFKIFWKKIIVFQVGFLLFNVLLVLAIFGVSMSKSMTNDIKNYKKFDIQVQHAVYDFFPDDINEAEIIKYEYFYNYYFHHVYSIYLEMKVDNLDKYLDVYREKGGLEQEFEYDANYKELVFDDFEANTFSIGYNSKRELLRGDIKKVLYSKIENTIIIQYFECWDHCTTGDVYYFQRFNIS